MVEELDAIRVVMIEDDAQRARRSTETVHVTNNVRVLAITVIELRETESVYQFAP